MPGVGRGRRVSPQGTLHLSIARSPRPRVEHVDNRQDVRDVLTTRRARLSPEQVGLPSTGTRRVPGLRRSEVATLALPVLMVVLAMTALALTHATRRSAIPVKP